MNRYDTIFSGKCGVFFESVLTENDLKKGCEVHVRGCKSLCKNRHPIRVTKATHGGCDRSKTTDQKSKKMKPKVIAFCGPAGVGKTTAATYLRDEGRLGDIQILSFAKPMRDMVAHLLPMGMESFTQENKNNPDCGLCGKSPRRMLETIGTEWGKQMIGANIWLEIVANKINMGGYDTHVIDDLRTDEEATYLRDNFGASIIHLSRPGIEYKRDHPTAFSIDNALIDHYVSTKDLSDLWVLHRLT